MHAQFERLALLVLALLFAYMVFYWCSNSHVPSPPVCTKATLQSLLEGFRRQPNLSQEQKEILADDRKWLLKADADGCEWTFHFPLEDPRSNHSWRIFFDLQVNQWVLEDPYRYGYPYGSSPAYAPYAYPYSYYSYYSYPYASYAYPYSYAPYSFSPYSSPYATAPLISPYDPASPKFKDVAPFYYPW